MTTSKSSEAQKSQSRILTRAFVRITKHISRIFFIFILCNMTDRPTDKVIYILDALDIGNHHKKNEPPISNNS